MTALTHIAEFISHAAEELKAMNDLADAADAACDEEILRISAGDLRAIIMDAIDNLPRVNVEPFGYGEAPRCYQAASGEFCESEEVEKLGDVIMAQISGECR